jgi:hypothetical protein
MDMQAKFADFCSGSMPSKKSFVANMPIFEKAVGAFDAF